MRILTLLSILFCFLLTTQISYAVDFKLRLSADATIFISQELFEPDKHVIGYYGEGSGKYPNKVDGKYFYGNDFDMPYWEVTDIRIDYKGVEYLLDHSSMFDMWHPAYKVKDHFYLSCSNNTCSLEGLFGDGAKTFMASWKFANGSSERVTLGGAEAEMLLLLDRLRGAR